MVDDVESLRRCKVFETVSSRDDAEESNLDVRCGSGCWLFSHLVEEVAEETVVDRICKAID